MMKKKILQPIPIIIALSISLSACSDNTYEPIYTLPKQEIQNQNDSQIINKETIETSNKVEQLNPTSHLDSLPKTTMENNLVVEKVDTSKEPIMVFTEDKFEINFNGEKLSIKDENQNVKASDINSHINK